MRISEKLNQKIKENKAYWSFEYFPPKTAQVLILVLFILFLIN
jgi:methylenetetrahydrofolate reductase (NADPH)